MNKGTDMNIRQVSTPDGISWYVEQCHPKPTNMKTTPEHIVLVPSGEGDCHSMRTVAGLLASQHNFSVTSFDMPGFSRTTGPREATSNVTPQLISKQITTLLDTLGIPRATFWGSSSGGGAALALPALYPSRVKCAIAHEVPFDAPPFLLEWRQTRDDEFIIRQCRDTFRAAFVEDINDGKQKWDALGPEYHKRLERNFLMWLYNVVGTYESATAELFAGHPENLKRRPVFWTVGALSTREFWASNWDIAEAAGLEINYTALNCLHFPYITIPEQMVKWIVECMGKVMD